jgi:hypothetical protein
MKKTQTLLLAFLIIGAGYSFTSSVSNDIYVLTDGMFVPLGNAQGFCVESTGKYCTYEIIDNPVEPIYTNPENFIPLGEDLEWIRINK